MGKVALFLVIWSRVHQQNKMNGLKKLWYAFITEFISVLDNSGILTFVGKWIELKIMMLSEISWTQKDIYDIYHTFT